MRKIRVKESFEGHPHGSRQAFTKGEEVEVAEAFAKLVVDKGHATYVDEVPAEKPEDEDEGVTDVATVGEGIYLSLRVIITAG